MIEPREEWPERADAVTVLGLEIFVYADCALIYPPTPKFDDGEAVGPLTEEQLRELAEAATWAANRLSARG